MTKERQRLRRRKASPAARVRPFWLLLVAVVVAVVAILAIVVTAPAMRPRTIDVRGNSVVSREEILLHAAVDRDRSMWVQDTRAMSARVESIPFIGQARVHRRPPYGLVIDVTERVPYAILNSAGSRVEVDRDLRVLEPAGVKAATLPVLYAQTSGSLEPGAFVADSEVVALRNDNDALAGAGVSVASITHDTFGDVVAVTPDGIRLLLGDETDLTKKIPLVNPILRQVLRAGKPVSAIDLRAPTTPIVVYRR